MAALPLIFRFAERSMRRGEPRDRHSKWRARDVIETDAMAERNTRGIAAMLAADTDLQILAALAPKLHAHYLQRLAAA